MKVPDVGIEIAQLLVNVGLCKSKNEARQKIKDGGVRIHDVRVFSPFARLCMIDTDFKLLDSRSLTININSQ